MQLLPIFFTLCLLTIPLHADTQQAGWSVTLPGRTSIPATGSFGTNIKYSARNSAVVVVDILNSADWTWYGKGTARVGAGSGTKGISVKMEKRVPRASTIILKVSIIQASDANKANAWELAKAERTKPVSVNNNGGSNPSPNPPSQPPSRPPSNPPSNPPPPPAVSGSVGLSSNQAGNTLSRFNEFIRSLTSKVSGGRAVHSSGGAAGGVVSEGQGYGVFFGAATAAAIGRGHPQYNTVISQTYEIFQGWKTMCMKSTSDKCQGTFYCTSGGKKYPCLPHWKFNNRLSSALETGSAPDGDEDAILGMIILARLTQGNKPSWWNEVKNWAYQSSKQFYESSTVGRGKWRIVKLGACWGGFDCNNPSYHAPGAYRAMRDFMKDFGGNEGRQYVSKWNTVIDTTYAMINAAQCKNTGLFTNWYVPNADVSKTGDTSCSGSGTPGDQYGAEASRLTWRVALDYLWYNNEDKRAGRFLAPIIKQVISKYRGGSFSNLDTGCLVKSIHSGWATNYFMFAPTITALVAPTGAANQQAVLNAAAQKLRSGTVDDYYSGSWLAIGTMTVNGDLGRLRGLMKGGSAPPSNPPSRPPSNPPSNPPSRPPSNPPSNPPSRPPSNPPSSGSCASVEYGSDTSNPWFFAVIAPGAKSVKATCSNGKQITCNYDADWKRFKCNGNCPGPRKAIVDGKTCNIKVGKHANANEADALDESANDATNDINEFNDNVETETGVPAWGIALLALGCFVVLALVVLLILVARR